MTVPPDGYRPRIGSLDIVRDLAMVLMTLGPMVLALRLVEGAQGRVARWLNVFGRGLLFYYLLHIPLIHLVALAIAHVRTPPAAWWLFGKYPIAPAPVPDGYMWSLGLLYLVAAGVVVTPRPGA